MPDAGGADRGRSGGHAASWSPNVAKSPPAWTAAAGGGTIILPINHSGMFFKTKPNDGPGQNRKNPFFRGKPGVSMAKGCGFKKVFLRNEPI